MPSFNRPVRCWWKRCKRILEPDEQRLTMAPCDDHYSVVALCEWHWRLGDTANRIRFWRRHRIPEVHGARVGDDQPITGMYQQRTNVLSVTQHFAGLEPPQQVYVLSHETLHWWLSREFGLLSSMALDLFYKQPLHVLGHHSLHTWLLNALYEQAEALNSPTV